ncbi:MAG: haloacid dehalogenase [Actinomycetota bacterium]|nr:haloacid dehalogenase [Actinomycetota bacterium]
MRSPPHPSSRQARVGYAAAVARVRRGTRDCSVVVFDLDDVVRDFAEGSPTPGIEADLGLPTGGFAAVAFATEHLHPAVTGQVTFARWMDGILTRLVDDGAEPEAARRAMDSWVAHRGTPIAETVDLICELEGQGRHCFLFTNGTDNVPAELRQIGLDHLLDGLLNSAELGVAKPDPEAFAAAHSRIEESLGMRVDRADVGFTDDREPNVAGAAAYGWQAVLFDPRA